MSRTLAAAAVALVAALGDGIDDCTAWWGEALGGRCRGYDVAVAERLVWGTTEPSTDPRIITYGDRVRVSPVTAVRRRTDRAWPAPRRRRGAAS